MVTDVEAEQADETTAPAGEPPRRRASATAGGDVTPMVKQYLEIRQAHPDGLLLFRMGDFYEMFFDDAVAASAALDIALTKRGRHRGDDIPMCGIPVHAADSYIDRLIRAGFKVAVCEQVEDPAEAKKRGPKAIVARDVLRVITPGTLTEETLLDARRHNYLVALGRAGPTMGLAWFDMSTGDLSVTDVSVATLATEFARLQPGEILISEALLEEPALYDLLGDWKTALTPLAPGQFSSKNGARSLKAAYGVASLDGFGTFARAHLTALGAIIDYVSLTQRGRLPKLKPPVLVATDATLAIDSATRRNLEIVQTLTGERRGSLLHTIDRTLTSAGARMLAQRLAAPLTAAAAINARLDLVQMFVERGDLRETVRAALSHCPDLERSLSRLSLGRGGPRDLAAVRDAASRAQDLRGVLSAATDQPTTPPGLDQIVGALGQHAVLIDRLTRALGPDLPLLARDGGFIAEGYLPDLDEQRQLRDESRRLIAGLQKNYAEATAIASLKIRHNNVLGYFVEVTQTHAGKIGTDHETFIHRQTLASAVRYTTVELSDFADRINRAGDQAVRLELALFDDLVSEVVARGDDLAKAAQMVAATDVASALAELAIERRYVRPTVNDTGAFHIVGGRHPVVEAALVGANDATFIANDCDLADQQRLWLVTGPNMAGKSTFLRQNALIVVLAQMGAFVPASEAQIGVVDRLFSRVGAADDLARGRSTFMVEMIEAAAILNQATPRSLVILDEIGRGTATFDGLSIAWATIEHLHEVNRCRALFATHFHELTTLASKLDSLTCYTMRIKEWQGDVVFLHEIAAGAADRSYGIQVAKLAGLPAAVVLRSEAVLAKLEAGEQAGVLARLADDLPLFAAAPAALEEASAQDISPLELARLLALAAELEDIDADDLTPRAALELLYRLKALAEDGADSNSR